MITGWCLGTLLRNSAADFVAFTVEKVFAVLSFFFCLKNRRNAVKLKVSWCYSLKFKQQLITLS